MAEMLYDYGVDEPNPDFVSECSYCGGPNESGGDLCDHCWEFVNDETELQEAEYDAYFRAMGWQ